MNKFKGIDAIKSIDVIKSGNGYMVSAEINNKRPYRIYRYYEGISKYQARALFMLNYDVVYRT